MSILSNTPIRRKIISIVMIICTVVLLVAYGAIAYTQWQSRHQLLRDSLSTLTRVVGINNSASLAFHDSETGKEILGSLVFEEQVISAELFSLNGELFASYRSHQSERQQGFYRILKNIMMNIRVLMPKGETNPLEETTYGTGFLEITQKIQVNARAVGSIRLRVSMLNLYESFARQSLLVAGLLLATLFAAFLLASYLQKLISRPILHLGGVASNEMECYWAV